MPSSRRHLVLRVVAIALTTMLPVLAFGTPPPTQPTTSPTTGPAVDRKAVEKRLADLTRQAIGHLEKGRPAEAERVLIEAIPLDPRNVTNLYNMACAQARLGHGDRAVAFLEATAEFGWTDFTHIARDPDLASLRDLPRYKQFLARKAEFQKRAAERALAGLKAQFGDKYLYDLDEERKLIFATSADATTLAELKRWLTDQANSQWAELFEHRPDHYVSVVVPSPADYVKIVRQPGVGGFYNDERKLLIAQRLGQVMTHEFTHALHAADRAPLGQDHPIWIAEGLAGLYEPAQFEKDGERRPLRLVPKDNVRHNVVLSTAKSDRLIPLAQLLKMEQPEFIRRSTLAYGQSASVMFYLRERALLRPFYDAYKKSYDKDATGRAAIEQVTGGTFEKFEADWKTWLKARPRTPSDTGPEGVVIGARMADANDGLRVETVVPNGPASKAGLKVGDVLVGLGDAQVRDYQSFVPIVLQFKAGETVTLKVRRAGEYIDLAVTLGKRSDVSGGAVRPRAP